MLITRPDSSDPRVVFISQLGVGGDSWQPIIGRLPGVTAFAYDRPGTGKAAPRPAPNPPLPHSAFARELADLLDQAGLTSPAVLVGHSFGGNIARVYAGQHPERVAGMVFVDSSIPQSFVIPSGDPPIDGAGPDATQIDTVAGQVEILTSPLPAVPALVLTRTPGMWSGDEPPPHPKVEDLWLTCQRILAKETGSPLIVADHCGHQLPRDVPDLLAYAIQAVVDAAQTGRAPTLDLDLLPAVGGHIDR